MSRDYKNMPWWQTLLCGLGCLVLAGFLYWFFTDLETTGGTRRIHRTVATLYELTGKWPMIICFGVIGFAGVGIGIKDWCDLGTETRDEAKTAPTTEELLDRSFWVNMCLATIVSGLLWLCYVAENWFGFPLFRPTFPLLIWVPLGVSPLAYGIAYGMYRQEVGFMSSAVKVTGRVTSIGFLEYHGTRDLGYSYTYDGKSYDTKRGVLVQELSGLAIGDEIDLLVDPVNPGDSKLVT